MERDSLKNVRLLPVVFALVLCSVPIALWLVGSVLGSSLLDLVLNVSVGAQVGGEDWIVDAYQQYESGEFDPFDMIYEGGTAMGQGFEQMGTSVGTAGTSVLGSLNMIWKGTMLFVGIVVVSIGGGLTVTYGRHGAKQLGIGIAGTAVSAWAVYGLYNAVKQGHIIPLIVIIVFMVAFNLGFDLGDVGIYASMVFTIVIVIWLQFAPWFLWDAVRFSWDFFGPLASGWFEGM